MDRDLDRFGNCVGRHDWECWWTEDVDVCRSCEKEQRCRHKSDRKALKEAASATK